MLLAQALSLHQSGRRAEAEAAYRALLGAEPANAAALHALGVLRHQSGDSSAAAELIGRAIAISPRVAEYHFNQGLALLRLELRDEAMAALAMAARLKPGWPEPHYDIGNIHAAAGHWNEAAQAYRAALRLRPDYLQAAVNLASVLKSAGKLDQAIATYRRVLRAHPNEAAVHHHLGVALHALGAPGHEPEAEAAFRAALRLRPDFAEALANLAGLLIRGERFAEALPQAESARAAEPQNAAFAELHGDALRGLKRYQAAHAAYQDALALQPGRRSARFAVADTYRLQRNALAAERELRALTVELPDAWQSHHDLANVLRDQGRFAEAEGAYRTALRLHETPTALKHLGAVLRDQQRLDDALAVLTRAAALAPKDPDIAYNLSITHLTAGRLREGFALYDSRLAKYGVAKLPGRAWSGEDPRGRTMLVVAEQGLGDAIQFVRYLPALAARGARIILRAPTAVLRLLERFPGVAELISRDEEWPRYDLHCQLMSLPALLGITDPLPIPVPYLAADAAEVERWRNRLAHLPGLRVGLVWAGNAGFAADHLRSIPVAALPPLARIPGISFVSLQKDAAVLPDLPLADFTAELIDMAETAALIGALDLVIGVDTGVIHLAGALGVPAWMLNRFDTCWRWQTGIGHSVWYPSLRLFRQTTPGDWCAPLEASADALAALAAAGGRDRA